MRIIYLRGSWNMDKKMLVIGCVCVVVVLIGVSFTSVVGYSSIKTKMLESPLYTLRTNRAIDNGEDVTTCDFLGKGRQSTISIPTINTKIAKVIEGIREMNDDLFSKFITQFIKYVKNENKFDDTNINQIVEALYQLRKNPDIFNYAGIENTITLNIILCGIILLLLSPLLIIGAILFFIWYYIILGGPATSQFTCQCNT